MDGNLSSYGRITKVPDWGGEGRGRGVDTVCPLVRICLYIYIYIYISEMSTDAHSFLPKQ